ncbi:MAG: hypothetical protein KDJ63_11670, partial [Nitratireductor sp.]|nr:hypothetical protein [Nitratireductor sp.]
TRIIFGRRLFRAERKPVFARVSLPSNANNAMDDLNRLEAGIIVKQSRSVWKQRRNIGRG